MQARERWKPVLHDEFQSPRLDVWFNQIFGDKRQARASRRGVDRLINPIEGELPIYTNL